jgi:hypothetical protein
MPFETAQFSLSKGVRVKIVTAKATAQHICIHNHEHQLSKEIFIGDSTVTSTTGIHAVATQTSMITLNPGTDLWAITEENAGADLHVAVIY